MRSLEAPPPHHYVFHRREGKSCCTTTCSMWEEKTFTASTLMQGGAGDVASLREAPMRQPNNGADMG